MWPAAGRFQAGALRHGAAAAATLQAPQSRAAASSAALTTNSGRGDRPAPRSGGIATSGEIGRCSGGWRATASAASAKSPLNGRLPRNMRRVTSTDLDAWAEGPAVLGHAHSRPTFEPYGLSPLRQLGGGAEVPAGWSARLLSAAGMKGGESPNQDAVSYTVLDSGWIVCVACDGHGEQGEIVAERVARMIPLFLSQHLPDLGLKEALPQAFSQAQSDLERCFSSAQTYSGATVVVCCIHSVNGEAWVAYAGDSRVVVGDLDSGEALFITGEHKAHDPEESQRLAEAGAQVITKRYEDGELVSRIFIPKTGVPGLAMSRSLGDGCLKKYGVIAVPDVHDVTDVWERSMAPFMVLASDGLWDTLTAEETVNELTVRRARGLDVQTGAEALLRRSQRLWIEAEGDYCDDISILLVAPSASLQLQ